MNAVAALVILALTIWGIESWRCARTGEVHYDGDGNKLGRW